MLSGAFLSFFFKTNATKKFEGVATSFAMIKFSFALTKIEGVARLI
jgi:hypothetical protein